MKTTHRRLLWFVAAVVFTGFLVHVQFAQAADQDQPVEVKALPGYAGYWAATGVATQLVGDPADRRALIEFKGNVRWDTDGKLTEGADSFVRIKTAADNDRWYKITDSHVESGILVITAEEGVYTKFTEGKFAAKTARPVTGARITKDGKWKGAASFFVTGFSPMGGATIYQDTRNYTVTKE